MVQRHEGCCVLHWGYGRLQYFETYNTLKELQILITIWLLIPYFSNCSLNFNALTSYHESACAPSRHPITLFQNNFLIYVPIVSMVVNSGILIYQKYLRNRWKSTASSISLSHVKRENEMIRQACFIGVYLSVYEILYLHMRLYPVRISNKIICENNIIIFSNILKIFPSSFKQYPMIYVCWQSVH